MWKTLLNTHRIGDRRRAAGPDRRSPFKRDLDRILFSAAFRRLQDKTQVFPLPGSDYVRTRLTHTLEVSTIGHSLGTMVGDVLRRRHKRDFKGFESADIGALVAAACLAHDIGNPPFGHSGESAIQSWFGSDLAKEALAKMRAREVADLKVFEGNAQGLRIITRLQSPDNLGGLQLTYATLGTFLKYPREVAVCSDPYVPDGQSAKKNGFFQAERDMVSEIATELNLVKRHTAPLSWYRHPLAFLMEAADDISYRVIDFEDGFRLGHIAYREAVDRFMALFKKRDRRAISNRLSMLRENKEKIEYLRAKAINQLIKEVVDIFLASEKAILCGRFDAELVSAIPSATALERIRDLSRKKVYSVRQVVEIEAAGFEVLGGLLAYVIPAVLEGRLGRESRCKNSAKYFELLPARSRAICRSKRTTDYERALIATDFVSGMTDSYAVALYKMLKGISLPNA